MSVTPYQEEHDSLRIFQAEFEKNGVETELYKGEFYSANCPDSVQDCDMIVYCTFCHQHKPCGALQILPSWQVGALARQKTVVVTFGSPYLIYSNFPTVNTAIALYSDTEECQKAAAKAIMGQIPFRGKLPVKMPQ